jgi:hypothetical protein
MSAKLIVFSLVIVAFPLGAANFSGKWLLTRQTGAGGRGPAPTLVTLNQVGSDLTGSVTPPRGNSTGSPANVDILGGKVDGETITFYLWTGLDKPVKNIYQGKLAGDEIVFTVTVDPVLQTGNNAVRSFQVTAKRVP